MNDSTPETPAGQPEADPVEMPNKVGAKRASRKRAVRVAVATNEHMAVDAEIPIAASDTASELLSASEAEALPALSVLSEEAGDASGEPPVSTRQAGGSAAAGGTVQRGRTNQGAPSG